MQQPAFQSSTLSRRSVIAGLAASIAGLTTGPAIRAQSSPGAASPTAGKHIATPYGLIAIPDRVERIVCVDWFSPENLLEFGVVPVGLPNFNGNNLILPQYEESVRDVPAITNVSLEADLEAIVGLEPDLILGLDWGVFIYDDLSKIAPTVLLEWHQTSGDWPFFSSQFAEVVGKEDVFNTLKQQYFDQAKSLATTYADVEAATKWALIEGSSDGQFYFYVEDFAGGVVLTDAGITLVDAAMGKTGTYEMISNEEINVLADADVILVPADPDGNPWPESQELMQLDLFKNLKAAEAGNVFPVIRGFPSSYGSAIALLDELEPILSQVASTS